MTNEYPGTYELDIATPDLRSAAGDSTHVWSTSFEWPACVMCGIVRRADRMHRPCPRQLPVISPRAHRCHGGRR